MSSRLTKHHQQQHVDLVFLYALQALGRHEAGIAEHQISSCEDCQHEMESLRPVVGSFVGWSTDVLRPPEPLWDRLAQRIAKEAGTQPLTAPPEAPFRPEWEEVGAGIYVKVLALDSDRDRVSMLVRLDPGTDYPPHTHAGVEELHLLHGELKVDEKTLYPGDFIHAEAGTVDRRVWTESGCVCVLMTSTKDRLF